MIEQRKKTEIEHYDSQAEKMLASDKAGDFEGFDPLVLKSFQFFYRKIKENCQDKIILDYGCGNGVHSVFPIKNKAKRLIGIDLSEKSLVLAKKRALENGIASLVDFKIMDCEKMAFADNSFDLIIDGGAFSSLDLDKALAEISRVLKPAGKVVAIETLGHNPLTNFKRKINKLTGKRTGWAQSHILTLSGLKEAENYFSKVEPYYFHLFSWLVFPFLGLPGAKILLRLLEAIETPFLKARFLKKYGFKVVFILSGPKRNA